MDRRALRKQRKQEQVREEILAAARRVVLGKGLGSFTLAAVARELQLSKAALYHYFDSKESLIFELVYQGLDEHARVIEEAVHETRSGTDAVEALIRTATTYYGERMDELRLIYMVPQVGGKGSELFQADQTARIRPINDRLYGPVAAKIRADQEEGRIAGHINGRRLAFVAHTSVLGMLTVEGLVEAARDGPLLHGQNDMVDELVEAFRARLTRSS